MIHPHGQGTRAKRIDAAMTVLQTSHVPMDSPSCDQSDRCDREIRIDVTETERTSFNS